jgi:hypothetical protein
MLHLSNILFNSKNTIYSINIIVYIWYGQKKKKKKKVKFRKFQRERGGIANFRKSWLPSLGSVSRMGLRPDFQLSKESAP